MGIMARGDYTLNTDEEIFAAVRDRADQAAFREIYRRYSKRIFAYCLQIVKNYEAAEDAFQSTMTSVYEKRDYFAGGNFSSWIFTIAKNNCITAWKKLDEAASNIAIEDVESLISDGRDPLARDIILNDALMKAIASLGKDYREAVEMRYIQDFTFEQIAEKANISLPLAKIRIARAKQKLQEILSPYFKELK